MSAKNATASTTPRSAELIFSGPEVLRARPSKRPAQGRRPITAAVGGGDTHA